VRLTIAIPTIVVLIISPSVIELYVLYLKFVARKNVDINNNSIIKLLRHIIFSRPAQRASLFLFTIAIVIQSIGNGYLLSDSFWQTKVTTALATVSIIRLFNIYKDGDSGIYAPIFEHYKMRHA
jgi:hypothetical protein